MYYQDSYLGALLKFNLPKKLWIMAPWSYPTRMVRELGYFYTAVIA